ncbi:MAG TPA: hypothetical protein VKB53_11545 [Gammaproteobacteria bacterium]|jgi:hypothetical protein|nr:hypothetical protein [Gammaproteobacteria bacterium]HKH21495.1 hypothetical protein [Gammaproteobacteria bacterium]
MADFEVWALAGEPQDENGTFIKEYRGNRQSAIESGLEGSPVATILREVIKPNTPFEGTATELLNTLNNRVGDRTRVPQSWPKSAKALNSQLRRLATALRTVGIKVLFKTESGSGGRRLIHIKPIGKEPQSSDANA